MGRLILTSVALVLAAGCATAAEPEPVSAPTVEPSASAVDSTTLAETYRRGVEERALADAHQAGWEEIDRTRAATAAVEESCAELAEPAGEAAFAAVWGERQPELDALDTAADDAFDAAEWDYSAPAYQAALERSETLFAEIRDEATTAREGAYEGAFYTCLEGGY